MEATDSVSPRTGNVNVGTSVFAMVVLERPLQKLWPEIDLVTTPTGKAVAMVHCNNCTSDLNTRTGLLPESATLYLIRRLHLQTEEKEFSPDVYRTYTNSFFWFWSRTDPDF